MFSYLSIAYHEVIYRPLLNLLVLSYTTLPIKDIGLAIVITTVLIRLLFWPLMQKQLKSQQAMMSLQPKLDEIKTKYKDDKEAQARETMALYKEQGVNPFGSCLPLLLQMPILIALYQVLRHALGNSLAGLYTFVANPGTIDPYFLGLMDLSKPSPYLSIVAGLLQFWQSKLMMPKSGAGAAPKDATAKMIQAQTTYFLPIISIAVAWSLPAGLPLYWSLTTLFMIIQQYFIMKKRA